MGYGRVNYFLPSPDIILSVVVRQEIEVFVRDVRG
jgi:hypothetical protein